jgi:hypothetical protein
MVMNTHPVPPPPRSGYYTPRKTEYMAWKKWFAWYPVIIHGQKIWLKTIYRRKINTYVDMDDWARYEYGTIFDVLTD